MSTRRERAAAIRSLERSGTVTPERLVTAARDKRHPLHNDFEWDNDRAGHKYRLDQARQLIASVRVVIKTETTTLSVVQYVRDPRLEAHEQGYVNVARVIGDRELAERVLLDEAARVQAAWERAREVAAALDLVAECEAALQAAIDMQTRIRRGRAQPARDEDQPSVP